MNLPGETLSRNADLTLTPNKETNPDASNQSQIHEPSVENTIEVVQMNQDDKEVLEFPEII